MKVLKFGGSSVATPQAIEQVRNIVEHTASPMVIVVSALGGDRSTYRSLTRSYQR